jgi:hypothetical protein
MDSEEVPAQPIAANQMQWRLFERLECKLSHYQRKVAMKSAQI